MFEAKSRARYKALRERGHGHARALRTVADRLLYVACAMLRRGEVFDKERGAVCKPTPAAEKNQPASNLLLDDP